MLQRSGDLQSSIGCSFAQRSNLFPSFKYVSSSLCHVLNLHPGSRGSSSDSIMEIDGIQLSDEVHMLVAPREDNMLYVYSTVSWKVLPLSRTIFDMVYRPKPR